MLQMKDKRSKYPKRTRLKDFSYKGCYRYFITLRSRNQASCFIDPGLVTKLSEILKETAEHRNFYVWAYCFMPDHLHLLVEGKTEDADMRGFIFTFKQKTAFWFSRVYQTKLWQPSYYERILRKDEAASAVARYILENPVRKGIVTDYTLYPHSGSLEVNDISQII